MELPLHIKNNSPKHILSIFVIIVKDSCRRENYYGKNKEENVHPKSGIYDV